jgi:hypothetical protein
LACDGSALELALRMNTARVQAIEQETCADRVIAIASLVPYLGAQSL